MPHRCSPPQRGFSLPHCPKIRTRTKDCAATRFDLRLGPHASQLVEEQPLSAARKERPGPKPDLGLGHGAEDRPELLHAVALLRVLRVGRLPHRARTGAHLRDPSRSPRPEELGGLIRRPARREPWKSHEDRGGRVPRFRAWPRDVHAPVERGRRRPGATRANITERFCFSFDALLGRAGDLSGRASRSSPGGSSPSRSTRTTGPSTTHRNGGTEKPRPVIVESLAVHRASTSARSKGVGGRARASRDPASPRTPKAALPARTWRRRCLAPTCDTAAWSRCTGSGTRPALARRCRRASRDRRVAARSRRGSPLAVDDRCAIGGQRETRIEITLRRRARRPCSWAQRSRRASCRRRAGSRPARAAREVEELFAHALLLVLRERVDGAGRVRIEHGRRDAP